jgi:DNA-binding transcriptional ArsR family regulator
MVKHSSAALDATFGALADPTRRALLARLALGERSLTELARPFLPAGRRDRPHTMSLVAVQKHVRVLERAGLVETAKEGRVRRCVFQARPLRSAAAWLDFYQKFWEDQFDALEDLINAMQKKDPSWLPRPAHDPPAPRARKSSQGKKERR